jgi:hypothetical protein
VNIDNGFGAGYQASLINQMAVRGAGEESVRGEELSVADVY